MRGCYSSHGNTDGILIRPLRGAYAPLFICLNIKCHGECYRGLDGFSRGEYCRIVFRGKICGYKDKMFGYKDKMFGYKDKMFGYI